MIVENEAVLKDISTYCKNYARKEGLKISQVAEELDMSKSTVSSFYQARYSGSGIRHSISIVKLLELLEYFDIQLEFKTAEEREAALCSDYSKAAKQIS